MLVFAFFFFVVDVIRVDSGCLWYGSVVLRSAYTDLKAGGVFGGEGVAWVQDWVWGGEGRQAISGK